MDLYDVIGRGLPSPLNSREISQLVRTGRIDLRTVCKPTGEARWRTIDELFPLLKYQGQAFSLTFDEEKRQRPGRFFAPLALVLVILGTLALFWWTRPPSDQGLTDAPPPLPGIQTALR